jgi:hypothetical protein
MAKEDMVYDGDDLDWIGVASFPASSGLPGHQIASEEIVKDHGPVPQGMYVLSLKDGGTARVTDPANNKIQPATGIQDMVKMPGPGGAFYHSDAWGNNRVRIDPLVIDNPKARHRSGFYIHDSTKGYSHGCIEVNPKFFDMLRAFALAQRSKKGGRKTMILKVKYPSSSSSTYGGTKVP